MCTGSQGSNILWCGTQQELLKAEKATSTYGQWKEELLEELHTQTELAQDALSIP